MSVIKFAQINTIQLPKLYDIIFKKKEKLKRHLKCFK